MNVSCNLYYGVSLTSVHTGSGGVHTVHVLNGLVLCGSHESYCAPSSVIAHICCIISG